MSRHIIEDMNSGKPETCSIHKTAMYWHGDWFCSECQQEQEGDYRANQGKGFEKCLSCELFDGDMDGGYCTKLKPPMPVSMCGRRRKCKHYKEYIEKWDGGW